MKLTVLLILATIFFACSNDNDAGIDTSMYNLQGLNALNYYQIAENDSIANFLSHSSPQNSIMIDDVRRNILKRTKEIKRELITLCGGRDDIGNFVNPTERKLVYDFFITQGIGREFQQLANSIVEYSTNQGIPQKRIALDASEIPVFKNDPNLPKKTFVDIHFGQANMIEALNAMSMTESFILQVESIYLNRQLMQKTNKGM